MEISSPKHSLAGAQACAYDEFPNTPRDVMERYLKWLDEQLYVTGVTDEGKIIWWRAAKRGSRIYVDRVYQKIKSRILAFVEEHQDLNYWKFLTLTVPETDIASIKVFRLAWNRFLTNLRKRYPRMRIFRVYELQKRGSVHLHAIIWGPKWIPTDWLQENWSYGRPNIQRPKSIKGITYYLTKYLTAAFLDPWVTSFMWFWRMRQWACNFPCSASKTNSNPRKRIFGVGVCILNGIPLLWDFVECSLAGFLECNGLMKGIISEYWSTTQPECQRVLIKGSLKPSGFNRYEKIAEVLRFNWRKWRNEVLLA